MTLVAARAAETVAPERPRSVEGRGFRADIQGLRAVAVLLVIANHGADLPLGGYIGVDVFFVISGFLITGLLIREHARTGRISFSNFYLRRVKRIAPAAVLVMAATVITAFFLFPLPRAQSVLADAGWAAVFAENWRLVILGTDYMHANDALSPLQHFWSLSVEEQFYLVWPALLVVILTLSRSKRMVVTVLALLVATSFIWSLRESLIHPTSAYFSTFTRVWELGTGALLAVGGIKFANCSTRIRTLLAWCGLATIAAGALLLNASSTFPAPWAVIPVAGAGMIIVAGSTPSGKSFGPLTNRVSVYLGRISYSLYLWHLPVIVFIATLLPQRGKKYLAITLALTIVLSVISYHWVEEPLRAASWRGRPWKTGRPMLRSSAYLAALLLVAGGLVTEAVASRTPAVAAARNPITDILDQAPPAGPATVIRARLVDEALATRTWPILHPAISALGPSVRAPEWVKDGCLSFETQTTLSPEQDARRCVYGNPHGRKTLALLGDSTAISFLPGIRKAAGPEWRIEVFTMSQCPAADVSVWIGRDQAFPECDEFHKWALNHIGKERPDLVVTTSTPWTISRLASHASDEKAVEEWKNGQEATFRALDGIRVVNLDAPPLVQGLVDCAIRGSRPSDCTGGMVPLEVNASIAVHEAAQGRKNVTAQPTVGWFCNSANYCPSFVETTPQYADNTHLTAKASRELAPVLKEVLHLD